MKKLISDTTTKPETKMSTRITSSSIISRFSTTSTGECTLTVTNLQTTTISNITDIATSSINTSRPSRTTAIVLADQNKERVDNTFYITLIALLATLLIIVIVAALTVIAIRRRYFFLK